MDQFEGWFQTLGGTALTPEQVKRLIGALSALAREPEEGRSFEFPALKAFFRCLDGLAEVQKHVGGWAVASHPEVLQLNADLGLGRYLGSQQLLDDTKEILGMTDEGYAGRDNMPLRLLVLHHLRMRSPAYAVVESLLEMGLTEPNREPLERFFARRAKALAVSDKTGIVREALSSIEGNAQLQIQYQKVQDKMKRKDFPEFARLAAELELDQDAAYKRQFAVLLSREIGATAEQLTQLLHQRATLDGLAALKQAYFRALAFFADRELAEGIKMVDRVMTIHHQMMQVCDNSVALIFIGLIKTGKSTIVDTIIGENVSPSRTDPMTAIPVRYVHDVHAREPVMLVPFALQLNRVVRAIKLILVERGREHVSQQLRFIHLRTLVDKIDRGLVFRDTYTGARQVLEASIDIHDLFRLAVQDSLPPTLSAELPLDWSQGLDSFLTVSVKFPHAGRVSSSVKLSVIDTPGVNEDGVRKLDLNQVITDAVDVCHYIAFTVLPRNNEAKDNSKLRKLIARIASTSKTPTLVLATNRDALKESPEELNTSAQNIANSLRESNQEYPLKSVYIVSGKRKLLGDKMLEFIDRNARKPELDDADEAARLLAEDWALFAGQGYDEEEKKDYYRELSRDPLKKRCEKLVTASNMKEPMDLMIHTATKNSSILSCNKAIEKSAIASKEAIEFLRRILQATEADATRANELSIICEQVFAAISTGVVEVRAALVTKVQQFKGSLKIDSDKALQEFSQTLPNVIEGEEQWEFKTKQDADVKVQESIRAASQAFNDVLDKVLGDKKNHLDLIALEIKQDTDEKIFKQLARIFVELNEEGKDFHTELVKPDFNLDTTSLGYAAQVVSSQEKSTSMKSKLGSILHGKIPEAKQQVFMVDVVAVREAAFETLQDYNKKLVTSASQRVEKYMNKILDGLFLVALRKVNQTREALSERERLRDYSKKVTELLNDLHQSKAALENKFLPLD